jgi:para-aminobenzoate synthetase component 1
MNIGFYDWVIAQDHARNVTWAIATGLPDGNSSRARERLDWIRQVLGQARRPARDDPMPDAQELTSNMARSDYTDAVRAVKEYIAAGDVYQVNVTQRYEVSIPCNPWSLYRRLRTINPAPFCAYLEYPDLAVLSASPEQFLNLKDGTVTSRPMKGTRPRGTRAAGDNRLAGELLASEKDRAENVMIVDLVRSDLGKVCVPGSIRVPELFAIEKYPTVWQMVSTVCGRMRAEVDATDLLRACFPGGSVTGAPKIRAMEIIDELEPTQRGVYCGAIGYVGFDGSMQMSVPIRILLAKGGKVYVPVGAGIVADSDPEAEYEETRQKARASFAALSIEH